MKEKDLYDLLQSLMPKLQFITPYVSDAPPSNGDYGQMNIMSVRDIGWAQERELDFDDEIVNVAYDTQRIYSVQFDFYGKNAFDNANTFKQNLHLRIRKNKKISLKEFSVIRNLTFLMENFEFQKRYNFDVQLFVCDTLELGNETYLKNGEIFIANRGNN